VKPVHYLAIATVLIVPGLALPAPTARSTAEHRPVMPTPLVIELAPPVAIAATEPVPIVWDLPVTRNERVDFWIRFLSSHQHRHKTALWLARSGRYGPLTREKLRERGMPEDLTYLALIESGFSPSAESPAQAIGLWQFIEETGRRYGLQVTPYLDERRDPVKSTDAALAYLQELHGRFGSWYLAAAAYNTGENRVERLLRERAGNGRGDEALYWTISPYLPQETRDYVPLMLAAGHIGKEPARYGFAKVQYHPVFTFDTVRAPGGTSLETIADATGSTASEIFDLNQHYVQRVIPPGRIATVRVPHGRAAAFASNFARASREARPAAFKRASTIIPAGFDSAQAP
jgi:membrane-bound lytic murein transglycosylase D